MKSNDPQLSALLKNWQDVEPRGSFEQDVWRRIRQAQPEPPARAWWQQPFWRPALAIAASLMIGGAVGVVSTPRDRGELSFLSRGTLTGSYVQLTSGGQR